MPATTPKRALPYPVNADAPNIAGDFALLALAVDARLGSAGKSIIATEESRTNTAYGLLTTPDRVQGVVLPAGGLIFVAYQAMWKESVNSAARAAIFVGANQLKAARGASGPAVQETLLANTTSGPNVYVALASCPHGLLGDDGAGTGEGTAVTTGQAVIADHTGQAGLGGACLIFAAAGTYDVSVQFKSSSGSVTVKERKLWVWTQPF